MSCSGYVEVGHHYVLVFEVVAVADISALVAVEVDDDAGPFGWAQVDGALSAAVELAWADGASSEDLERCEVDWVVKTAGELPDLSGAQRYRGVSVIEGERSAVDVPAVRRRCSGTGTPSTARHRRRIHARSRMRPSRSSGSIGRRGSDG